MRTGAGHVLVVASSAALLVIGACGRHPLTPGTEANVDAPDVNVNADATGADASGDEGAAGGGGANAAAGGSSGRDGAAGETAQPRLKKLGEACAERLDCASTFCPGGVCCDAACEGSCESCALPGTIGVCSPRAGGSPCGTASCNGNALLSQACDGRGACRDNPAVICAPYACNPTLNACNDTCASDADCASRSCVAGSCGAWLVGAACIKNAECASGFCSDGMCCNVACEGACVSCVLPGRRGTCWPVDDGAPDPRRLCVDQGPATCGTTGACDGAGACRRYPPGTTCSPPSCLGSTLRRAGACDASGACVAPPTSCAPFTCRADVPACHTGCVGDATCPSYTYCSGDEVCLPKKGPGLPCESGHECLSASCLSGVDGGPSTCALILI